MTRSRWIHKVLTSAAIFAAFFVSGPVVAEDVTITSKQGALAMTGRVIGFDGTYLTLESPYGPLTLDYGQVSCAGAACPDPKTFQPVVRLSGAGRMGVLLLPALVEGFARSRGETVSVRQISPDRSQLKLPSGAGFSIHATTSAEGFADLISFQTDIAMSLREVRPSERNLAAEVGIGDLEAPGQSRMIGFDGLVPIVSPRQEVEALSLTDLSKAFAGDLSSWSELGGDDVPITLHLGPRTDGEVEFFLDRVLRAAARSPAPSITYHPTWADMASAVATDPGGLGIGRYGRPTVARPVILRDACGFVARPDATTIKTQDYPLTTPLFLYLPDWRLHPLARDFLAFLQTTEAQLIIRRAGFVDQQPQPVTLDSQGQRFASAIAKAGPEIGLDELQRMVGLMTGPTRQSISFRFEPGQTRLNAGSRARLLALARSVRDGDFDGRTLWLLGFSDGQGDAQSNRALSLRRAETVRDLLGTLPESVSVRVAGFGEALPMACDASPWGRETNRRVELWLE